MTLSAPPSELRDGDKHRERARLAWRCRRGMLELDLLLQGFVNGGGYEGLDEAEQGVFLELLTRQDQELLELLMLQQEAGDRITADVITKIRCSV